MSDQGAPQFNNPPASLCSSGHLLQSFNQTNRPKRTSTSINYKAPALGGRVVRSQATVAISRWGSCIMQGEETKCLKVLSIYHPSDSREVGRRCRHVRMSTHQLQTVRRPCANLALQLLRQGHDRGVDERKIEYIHACRCMRMKTLVAPDQA
jgi:hypothetical protein